MVVVVSIVVVVIPVLLIVPSVGVFVPPFVLVPQQYERAAASSERQCSA